MPNTESFRPGRTFTQWLPGLRGCTSMASGGLANFYARRGPDAQRMRWVRIVDLDAHRHALRDLHPVAGGVLRREERERGAAPPREGHPRPLEGGGGIDVGLDPHPLPRANLPQLRLL